MVSELSGQINESKELSGEIKKIGAVTGEIYPTGNAGTIEINKVITGDPGTEAKVENEGTKSKAILNITIPKGDKGETGAEGKGIKSIVEYYQISTSNTIAPNTWKTTVPALTNINKYLWKYTVVSYTDNSTSSTMPAVIGVYGDTGEKGEKGDEGVKGDKGETGNKGDNGISPIITTSKNGKVTTITITDAEGTHTATINDGKDGNGIGDMLTSVYDIDKDGIVDNAKKVNGHTIESNVPANAIFTDTTYSIATNSVDGLMSKNDKTKLDNLANYDDTSIKADIQTIKTNIDTNTKNIDKKANSNDVYTKTETDTKLNKMDEGIANAVEKTGDTMTGDLNMQSNSVKFGTTGNVLWKENGYGDKFRIIPDFNGAGANNKLIIQSTTGEAGTDPQNWKDLVTIHADSGGVYNGVSGKKLVETSDLLNLIYPVGSIYISVNSTNPANLFGGTWTRIANGRTLIGVDENNGNFNSAKKTGGSFSHNHTNPSTGSHVLTLNEMPSRLIARINLTKSTDQQHDNTYTTGNGWKNICLEDAVNTKNISQVGLGHTHTMENTGTTTTIPQYFTCYIWQRTA